MIICTKCGMDNQLGRVFCTSCGTKLDLTHMSTQAIAKDNEESWMSLHWKQVVFLPLFLVVVLLVGLVFWPSAAGTGAKGTPASGRRLEGVVSTLAKVNPALKMAPIAVSEAELNAYLENCVVSKGAASSFNIKLVKGLAIVHMSQDFVSIGSNATIGLSFDAKCLPVGGTLQVAQASVGHMTLVGPMLKIAGKAFARALAAEPKHASLANINDIKIEDGKATIGAGKK